MCLKWSAKFLLKRVQKHSILTEFCASFQPEGVEAQMRRVYSATINLLSESHEIVTHYLKVLQTTISFCTWITSSTSWIASKRSDTQGCFEWHWWLSFLPNRLHPAVNRFHLTYTEEQLLRTIFCLASAFHPAIYITRLLSPLHCAPLPYLLLPITLNIFYQRRRKCLWHCRLDFTFSLCANSQPHSLNLVTAQPQSR